MTGPERIWIDRHGGNWSPVDGGTQDVEYIRRDPAILAALPEVQALIAAASAETLTLVLAIVTDIASTLLSVGDDAGANALCVLIKTLEQHNSAMPKSVSEALTPSAATAALAQIEREAEARGRAMGLREAATLLREQGYGTAPKQILARAAEIEKEGGA